MADTTIRQFRTTITGRQMLMHNGQLADPLNDYSKALKQVTSKRKKSDEDHEKVAEIEFQGGLYFSADLGPYIPGAMLDSVVMEGARKKKLGRIFESCVHTVEDGYRLDYDGPRTRETLWADPRFRDRRACGVQAARVIRTRPKFTDWAVTFELELFPCELNPGDVKQAIVDAGIYVGIGDFRPRFGLFVVKSFEEIGETAGAKTKKRAA